MIKCYVINLIRRPDRLERFKTDYNQYAPKGVPLIVVDAIDGSSPDYQMNIPDCLLKYVSAKNDYDNKPTVHATIYSHLKVWHTIANSNDLFGIIFEDDALFGHDRLTVTTTLINAMGTYPKNRAVLFFGAGDCLPKHTNATMSESLLRAQEKSHVTSDHGYYGPPNYKSAYVFDWLGGSSYILSKEMAIILLRIAELMPIDCAIDSWMKKMSILGEIEISLTIPLLMYVDQKDSDTKNITDLKTFS